jgi:hypothetical protein
LLLFLGLFISTTLTVPSGAAIGMDIDLIRNIKNYVVPKIITEINALVIPRLDHKDGYVEDVRFQFGLVSLDSIQFSFNPQLNAIVFTCSNIFGQITGKFKQKLLLISASGNFKAST